MISNQDKKDNKNILIAFILNASFTIIEIIGAYLTNSMAIFSDAIHDLGDSFALLFAYFSERFSHKKSDSKFTYGYRRFSVLSAFINGVILLIGSVYIIYEAIQRIGAPEAVKPGGMLGLALLGIGVNSIAAYKMSKDKGLNQRMVMYHLLEDILGWISVLIVSIILFFRPWYVLDSILSILISLVILRTVYKNLIKIGAIFLQRFPSELKINELEKEILKMEEVKNIHAIRGWSVDESNFSLSFHVVVSEILTIKEVDLLKIKIREILSKHNVKDFTLEFEADCSQSEGFTSV